MKLKFIFTGIVCFVFLLGVSQQTSEQYQIGKYFGRTPCQELAKQINEKATAECIKIKWKLTLYKDVKNTNTGTYVLQGLVYKKENPLLGQWRIVKGTPTDSQAIVYEIIRDGKEPLFLQKGDEHFVLFG